MTLTVLDLFAGAGGSSIGLTDAGMRVVLAANHWRLAVDVHQDNHPAADHDCADISQVDPRRYPPTDILWASPECTNHSVAKGKRRPTAQMDLFDTGRPDPAAERSRATMWDVIRFVEAALLRGRPYRAIVVENVVDVAKWMFWPAWTAALAAAGYDHRVVWLNSAFTHGPDGAWAGAPQYRDRLYVVAWQHGAPAPDLDIRPPAHCPACGPVDAVQTWKQPWQPAWGRWRAQYVYRCPTCRAELTPAALPAAIVIDWTNLGARIADRRRPLATATRERIRAGLARYGQPLTVPAGGTWNDTARPVGEPIRTRTTRDTDALACPPMVIPVEARTGLRPRHAAEPLRTQTSRLENALITAEPFLAMLRQHTRPSPVSEPLSTVVAAGQHHGLVTPDAILAPYYTNATCSHIGAPAPTLTTKDRCALVTRTPDQVDDREIDDCTFRMLTPAEVLAAMAFPTDYRMRGTNRDRVRMAGNAVTPPAARLLATRLAAALEHS